MSVQGGLLSAAYAFVPVTAGGFGTASWDVITNNLSGTSTTGDTVIDTSVMGLYTTTGGASASFVTVPEPSALSLLAVGICGLALRRKGRSHLTS